MQHTLFLPKMLITITQHHPTNTMNNIASIPCPHQECPYAFPQIKGVQSQIRQHLITLHTHQENITLNPSTLHKLHCYSCNHCHTIFATVAKQQQHTQHHALVRTSTSS
jgi:hypothetical protein